MNTEEIIKNNILINTFMGGHQIDEKYHKVPDPKHIEGMLMETQREDELAYHSDYTYLMCVVEFIADMKHWTLNATMEWLADEYMTDGIADMDELYQAVVAHVKKRMEATTGLTVTHSNPYNLFQLMGMDGEILGLYVNTQAMENPQAIFDSLFKDAMVWQDEDEENDDIMGYVDERLDEEYGIVRTEVELLYSHVL